MRSPPCSPRSCSPRPTAYNLGRHALRILFQHAPEGVDIAAVTSGLEAIPGVREVHDVHVWTLTSGMEVASAHLVAEPDTDAADVLAAAQVLLAEQHHLPHATVQVEPTGAGCHQLSW